MLYARWRLSHIPSTCVGRTISKQIRKSLYLHHQMQVLVLQHTYDTLDMLYAYTVLTLTLPLGPRDTVCVLNACYTDLNGTGQPSASYSDSTPRGRRALRHNILFHPWVQGSMVGCNCQ